MITSAFEQIPPPTPLPKGGGDSWQAYQRALLEANRGSISTEILDAPEFYYAEEYHQQYLAKNPWGYCGLGGTGIPYPVTATQAR